MSRVKVKICGVRTLEEARAAVEAGADALGFNFWSRSLRYISPADAALMMQLGCDGVFVGSGVFKSGDPAKRARAIVQAVTHYKVACVMNL